MSNRGAEKVLHKNNKTELPQAFGYCLFAYTNQKYQLFMYFNFQCATHVSEWNKHN